MPTDTFTSGGTSIPVEVFTPAGPGPHPAVVVLYGTRGLTAPFGNAIRDMAGALAKAGHVVLLPEYFVRTGTAPGHEPNEDLVISNSYGTNRDVWLAVIDDCVTYAAGRGDVDPGRLGLIGFSMGGHLALRRGVQAAGRKFKAVVDFFGPVSLGPFGDLADGISNLPPVQIHHGDDDPIVPLEESRGLVAMLRGVGRDVDAVGAVDELHIYPGEGHGFQAAASSTDAQRRATKFFQTHL